jgi:beta-N-acetylhexosaminidase
MFAHPLPRLAGQALVAGFPAGDPPQALLEAASRGELGGFILFRRNLGDPTAVAELVARLVASCPADAPPFIGVDQEGGRVQRLGPPIVQLPPMRVLGEIDDPGLTEAAASLLGRQLCALGVNLDFAPVLDVDSNPNNPIIGDRSFGADPALVARHGMAFARGLQQAGVAACGKHFPGHGDTALDSHLALPRLAHAMERLERIELLPFRAAAAQLDTLMTAHIVFDALDPGTPATLSRATLHGLLREGIGFEGVIFSDDLEMKAISDHYGVAEAACDAVAAGCDALLICSQPELCLQAHAALVRRAEREPAFAARLLASAERSLAVRRKYRPRPLQGEALMQHLLSIDASALEHRIAESRSR